MHIADSLMEACGNAERKIEFHQVELAMSKRRLAAIEKGEFTISERGAFQFNDEELKVVTGMEPIAEIVARERKIALKL